MALRSWRPDAPTLNGKTLGLLSNNKPHSEELLRMIAAIMKELYDIKDTVEYNKGSHQWPANSAGPEGVRRQVRCGNSCHCRMRVLHRVQCARRNGDRAAGYAFGGSHHPALRQSGPGHVPHAGQP